MTLDYNDCLARSIDQPAFSNATEGMAWTENWCGRCRRDQLFRTTGKGSGCPLVMISFQNRTPAEWMEGPRDEQGRYSLADRYTCLEFRPYGGGGREPRPKPEPPDMDGLFPPLDRGTRMYVQPELTKEHQHA